MRLRSISLNMDWTSITGIAASVFTSFTLIPQLIKIIRDQYLVDAKAYNKVMGVPITKTELLAKIREMLTA